MNSSDFFEKLENSTYGKEYLRIVSKGSKDLTYEKGFERHHILPRSLGGTNEKQNLVKLTTYQHVLAHYYLALGFPSKETIGAFSCITRFHQFKHLSELEQITLQQLEHWSKLREQAALERSKDVGKNTKGRIWMNFNDKKNIRVSPNSVEAYEKQGWVRGRSSLTGNNIRKGQQSSSKCKQRGERRRYVTDLKTGKEFRVKISELNQFLQTHPDCREGRSKSYGWCEKYGSTGSWNKGQKFTEEQKFKLSEAHKNSPNNKKGWVWYTNGDQDIRIDPKDAKTYEIKGFWKGKSHGWGSKENIPEVGSTRGTTWVTNGKSRKRIQKNLLDLWLEENPGWIKGSKYVPEDNA